ncbi:MAG TPA: FAD-dependent oxidoreductase [Phycisphaerales bacterium]|nr:FAD-dependent oxidoreductase [Phycisphaerales bacterium]
MADGLSLRADAVIFGGGVAGLWLLDALHREGYAVILLENGALGQGQTVVSQGIIHGGLKYTLSGAFTSSAASVREMPEVWRTCLEGRSHPNLQRTRVRAQCCYLWRTESIASRLGMIGASVGLRVKPTKIADSERPAALALVPGTVSRLDEQVIDPASLLSDLALQHRTRILKTGNQHSFKIAKHQSETVVTLNRGDETLHLRADTVILTAGKGNAELREQFGLKNHTMQLRPLHMVMVRGENLPEINGHCVDGSKTRVTITSDRDRMGRIIWQVGGQLAEDGVDMDERELIAHARQEISESMGGLALPGCEWATYRVDRAEAATSTGIRPDGVAVIEEGKVLTAWPTKLALAPMLSKNILAKLPKPAETCATELESHLANWPRPDIALPPWELERTWFAGD